jgi:hypothetical protein
VGHFDVFLAITLSGNEINSFHMLDATRPMAIGSIRIWVGSAQEGKFPGTTARRLNENEEGVASLFLQVILLDTHVVLWLTTAPGQSIGQSQVGHRGCAQEWVRFGNFRHHSPGAGDTREEGPHPPRYHPGILPAGNRGPICGPTDQWSCVCARHGISNSLSQRSSGSHDRSHRAGRGLSLITADRQIHRSRVVKTIW